MYCVIQVKFSTSPIVSTRLFGPLAPLGTGKMKSLSGVWVVFVMVTIDNSLSKAPGEELGND